VDKLQELAQRRTNRRNFMAGIGAVGAATALAGCGSSQPIVTSTNTTTSTAIGDSDILNFALNLEYLEAQFYLYAATGAGLTAADTGTGAGTVTGGAKVTGLSTPQQNILNEIAYDEQQHVRFLRSALGSAAVPMPNIDITNSFNALANAAGIASTFNPYADFNHFLVGAFIFEDVGVTAYNGAAPLISNAGIAAGYLTAAAGIMAVEAYHAAYIRTALTGNAITLGTTAFPYLTYANQVAVLRATLGGGNETALTVPSGTTSPTSIVTPSSIVAANANAIAYARTTDQVLHIVYGAGTGAGLAKGGFFPNGLNGKISVTAS
jgi:Ferritin-like domain/TAT (twin-arginine translocation) pathway signal sequence